MFIPLAGHHRQQEDELGAGLGPGSRMDHVVRRHHGRGSAAPAVDAGQPARELAEILTVVEDFRCFHVICAVALRLDQEQVFRVADVLLQVLRHPANGLNRLGKMR